VIPTVCSLAIERWFRAIDSAFQRRRQDWEPVGNKFVYEGVPAPPVV